MKFSIRNILISLTILSVGCGKQQPTDNRLTAAWQIVDTDPYTVFEILDSIPTGGLATADDSALYNLLYIEALHNVGLYTKSDSMIAASERFYRRSKQMDKLVRAYLQHGISFYNTRKYLRAVQYLKDAELMARNLPDNYLQFSIQTMLGQTNAAANCKEIALKHFKRSLSIDDPRITVDARAQCLSRIASLYERLGKTDSFIHYIRLCKPLSTSSAVREEVMAQLGNFYFKQKNYQLARNYIDSAMTTSHLYETAKSAGDLYEQLGNKEKACDYYYMSVEARDPETRIASYKKLIAYAKQAGDARRELSLSHRLNREYENYQAVNATEIANYQTEFDARTAARQIRKTEHVWMISITALLLSVLVIYLSYRVRTQKYRQIIEQQNARYIADLEQYTQTRNLLRHLRHERQSNNALIATKMEEIRSLQQKLADYQEDRQKPENWALPDTLLNAEAVLQLHNLAAHGRSATTEHWQAVYDLMSEQQSTFVQALDTAGLLSHKERNICLLIRLRFIPSEIAALTASSSQSVTNIRVRLLNKLFNKVGGAKDFDAMIRQLGS